MKLSTRNQLAGTVEEIQHGVVMSVVMVRLVGGPRVTASITRAAAEELELTLGAAVTVLVKSTDVMLAVE